MKISHAHVLAISTSAALITGCGGSTTSAPALPPAAPAVASTDQAVSEQTIRSSVGRLAQAWNAGDGAGWAAEYWTDGQLINILGVAFPTSAAVQKVSVAILAGPFHGSTFVQTVSRVRFPVADVAIADADIQVTGFRALPPGAVATSPGVLLTKFVFVYTRRNGAWRILSSQNTAVAPGPAPATSPT